MFRRVTLALFVLSLALPLAGCWRHRGLCRDNDSCSSQYYTPINDCDR
jgi:hypothetical protein